LERKLSRTFQPSASIERDYRELLSAERKKARSRERAMMGEEKVFCYMEIHFSSPEKKSVESLVFLLLSFANQNDNKNLSF